MFNPGQINVTLSYYDFYNVFSIGDKLCYKDHPLGCGCWLCCCGQKLIYKLNEVPGYPETKPERG